MRPDVTGARADARPRTWLRRAAGLLAALCFAWVAWPVWRESQQIRAMLDGSGLLHWLLWGVLFYVLLNALLAIAWWWLTGVYGHRLAIARGYAIWAKSQWAKYLPGNVMQFVSRQFLGREAGLSHPALVASGLLEIGCLMTAALAVALAASFPATSGAASTTLLAGAAAVGLISTLLWPRVDPILRRWRRTAPWMRDLPSISWVGLIRVIALPIVLDACFFAGAGLLLFSLVETGWSQSSLGPWQALQILTLAWIGGFVAVGAPAGVGVREVLLTVSLEPQIGAPGAAAAALLLRLVTTGGDLLTALVGFVGGRHWHGGAGPA